MDWHTLPEFLLCSEERGTDDDRVFVLHTHDPRFLMEFTHDGEEGETRLIDPPTDELPALKHRAHDFYCGEFHCGEAPRPSIVGDGPAGLSPSDRLTP